MVTSARLMLKKIHSYSTTKAANLTTGVGTLRFAAPEQIKAQKKRAPYDYKVDVYSLGVVLLDMFRDHDISYMELSDIHSAMLKGKVEENLAKKMDEKTVILIEKMVS